ncbi:TIGR01777 family oxidoreductase [Shewanella sp. NIFS-20-20]|uniref:TIGR01777 family oxidoreductase n=1 Tax=Shewanella sp. NIFS-20-20 TaxID=2853806 RepID=UPI001C46F9DB|nr:TIGR01777 family oxidoreductase [Shewanella sp. NIFS-20-20]MBV7316860.1 TIGR01777 family oxidoreductase [Shewanella sp. NIFS-20-20]
MKILLTGATGFIGHHLIKSLPASDELIVVSRQAPHGRQAIPHPNVSLYPLDAIKDVNDIDVIINLAGEPIIGKRWSASQKQILCQSRWQTTDNLVNLIAQSTPKPRVLINASAVGIYGTNQPHAVDEATAIEPPLDFAQEICRTWEQKALAAQSSLTRVSLIRIGIVLGDGGALAKMKLPFSLGLGGKIADGHQGMSWVHIDDLVALLQHCIHDPHYHGLYNATAPNPVSNREFTQALGQQLQRPTCLPMPAFMLNVLLGESAMLLTQGQWVLPKRAIAQGFHFKFPDLAAALQDIYPQSRP